MFGAEAIAQRLQYPSCQYTNTEQAGMLPQEYMVPNIRMLNPWGEQNHSHKPGFDEDFIMIAEFSEIEGPKPVILLPKDGGGEFDMNDFALRIMAVDHQSSVSIGFHITEDMQVVRSDLEQGIYAFVHHFVLHDHFARGFVRPFSMSYLTRDHRKLMSFYEDISSQMKKVSHMFRYGNRLVFVKDLERHLKDLEHTKELLIHKHSRTSETEMEDKTEDDILRSLKAVEASDREIRDIINILKPLLNDRILEERFHKLEQKAKVDHRKSSFDASSLQDCDYERAVMQNKHITSGSLGDAEFCDSFMNWDLADYKPKIIEIDGIPRKFDKSLRGFHQLCSWGAKDGLQRLRAILEYFIKDMATLELDRLDSHLMDPPSSLLSFSHGTIGANLLTDVDMLCIGTNCCRISPGSQRYLERWSSFETIDSFKSATSSCQSLCDENETVISAKSSILGAPISDPGDQQKPVTSESSDQVLPTMSQLSLSRNDLENSMDMQYVHHVTDSLTAVDNPTTCVTEPDTESNHKTTNDNQFSTQRQNYSVSGESISNSEKHFIESNIVPSSEIESTKKRSLVGCESESKNLLSITASKNNYSVTGKAVSDSENVSIEEKNYLSHKTSTENKSTKDVTLHDSSCPKSFSPPVSAPDTALENVMCYDCSSKETDIDMICSQTQEGQSDIASNPSQVICEMDSSTTNAVDVNQGSSYQNFSLSPQKSSLVVSESLTMLESDKTCQNVPEILASSEHSGSSSHIFEGNTVTDIEKSETKTCPSNMSFRMSRLSESIEECDKEAVAGFAVDVGYNTGEVQADDDTHSIEWYNKPEMVEGSDNPSPSVIEDLPVFDEDSLSSPSKRNDSEFIYYNENEHTMTVSCPEFSSLKKMSLFRSDSVDSTLPFFSGPFLQKLLNSYINLHHVIYSLLIGRPVVVMGTDKFEMEVREVVHALRTFLPTFLRHRSQYSDWYKTKQLKLSDLCHFKLCGLCRPDRKNIEHIILQSVKKYVTVIDVEKRVIQGPVYHGDFIYGILNKRKVFKTEESLVSYIEMCLTELSSKAFIFYHCYCLNGGTISETSGTKLFSSMSAPASTFLGKLGIFHDDIDIVQYLADVIKFQQIEEHHRIVLSTDMPVRPLPVTYSPCRLFTC